MLSPYVPWRRPYLHLPGTRPPPHVQAPGSTRERMVSPPHEVQRQRRVAAFPVVARGLAGAGWRPLAQAASVARRPLGSRRAWSAIAG